MAVGETQTLKHRRKMPSFSSSLLDAIYHSIDDPHSTPHRRNAAAHGGVDEEIESLRRAIMIEKWMANHTTKSRHLPSNSASSTDSSSCIFTASDTDSSTPRPPPPSEPPLGRFTRTKSRALKIYGELKKAKEPTSPGGRIASFINSIFSPRNPKREKINHPEYWSSVRKSRSMKDTSHSTTNSTSAASRSCLINNANSSRNNKSKRSVRFSEERSHGVGASMAEAVGSRYIKKNMESIRLYENEREFDDKSCASSDLFELENIGNYEAELPVYGTTHVRMNRAISTRN